MVYQEVVVGRMLSPANSLSAWTDEVLMKLHTTVFRFLCLNKYRL